MINMSYCIFENVLEAYKEAFEHLKDVGFDGLSELERKKAIELFKLSKEFVNEFGNVI